MTLQGGGVMRAYGDGDRVEGGGVMGHMVMGTGYRVVV